MRVAVFGGTGFVGSYLIDALIASNHAPAVLVRQGSENKLRHARRCRVTAGDLNSADAVEATLEDCDAIVYSVGILRENPKRGITFEALQYESVVRVAESATSHGISRFILMSANGVKAPGTRYQETKFRAEEHLKAGGLRSTIFRPSVIFGDPRETMEIATQLCRDMIAPPLPAVAFFACRSPARGAIRMSPVHVEDVALAVVRALEDPNTIGRTYSLGGPETLTWSDMLRRIAQSVGKEKWILPMPISLMRLAAALLDRFQFFPVTRDQLTMLEEGNTVDLADLELLIGKPPAAFSRENLAYLNR
jgi:NADH dehydrogenase